MTPQDPPPSDDQPTPEQPADDPGEQPTQQLPPEPPPADPPPPPPAGSPPPRRLQRTTEDKLVAGVAGGLGRHFDLDPALVRVGFVVLSLFGGSGIALYVILWLLLPSDARPARIGSSSPRSHKVALGTLILLLVCTLPFTGPGFLFAGPALLVVAVIAAFGVLLWRAVGGEGSPTLTRVALVIVAITGAVALGLGAGVAAAFGAGTVVAGLVIVAGLGLIVGGFLGGARWLIIPAVVMALPLAVVSAADIDLKGGVGQRDYRPSSMDDLRSSYRLGAGEMRIDLRDLDLPAGRQDLKVHVGVGRVELTVPDTVCVQTDGHVGAGQIDRFGRTNDGIDVRVDDRPAAAVNAPLLVIDADAGMGQIQIDHQPDSEWNFHNGRQDSNASADARQPACRT